jgi:hypothetical protein
MNHLSPKLFVLFFLAALMVHAQDAQVQILNANQVSKLDLSGKWSGKRNQYSWDHKTFIESFQYEFDLQQEGNLVTGTSTIIDDNGNFADMKLEGVIIGNKLHFREYQVQDAIRPTGMVWCFKSGELNFTRDGDNLILSGATPSYMEDYNYPCSGGETNLTKLDNSANLIALSTAAAPDAKPAVDMNINAYPNPFVESANISYTLTDVSTVKLEVFDISGKLMTTLYNGSENAGTYTFNFNAKDFSSMSGIYVVKMTLNDNIYSRQMVQMR